MIYLIRHGETNSNKERRLQGHIDTPLNEHGKQQAAHAATILKDVKIDKIYTSDLARANETGRIINEYRHLPLVVDVRIRENNYGDLENLVIGEITSEQWYLVNHVPGSFNNEGFFGLFQRVKAFYDEVKNQKNILIVTHAGTLRMFLYVSTHDQYDADDYQKFFWENTPILNCEIYEINPGVGFKKFEI